MTDVPRTATGDSPDLNRAQIRALSSDLLNQLEPLYREITSVEREAKEALVDAVQKRIQERVRKRLRETSIDSLSSRLKRRPRAAALEDLRRRGIRSAADLQNVSAVSIAESHGISIEGAEALLQSAAELRKPTLSDLQLPADPDAWDGADETVGRALQFWRKSAVVAASIGVEALAVVIGQLTRTRQGAGAVRWAFSGSKNRRRVRWTANDVRRRIGSAEWTRDVSAMTSRLADLRHHRNVPVDRSYWRKNSATLLAELEQAESELGSRDVRSALAYSLTRSEGLSSSLAEKMSATVIDLDRVRRPLRRYQLQGAKFALCVDGGLLCDEMGLGKTTEALAAVGHSISHGETHHVVVCPASLLSNWESEIASVLDGVPSWRAHGADRAANVASWEEAGGILLSSYHLKPVIDQVKIPFTFLIVDEAHFAKDPKAARSKLIRQIRGNAAKVLLLTGTPLVNEPSDMVSLLAIADPKLAVQLEGRFGRDIDVERDSDAFRHAVAGHYLRRRQRDVLTELPSLTRVDYPVELSSMEELRYKESVAEGNFTRMRIAATVADRNHSSKIAALQQIIGDIRSSGRKVLIFSDYREVLERAFEMLADDALLIYGGVSQKEVGRREADFRGRSGFAALIGQIDMVGVGKNYQEASAVIIMEPQYTAVAEDQAIRRALRMGQTSPVTAYRIVALGTVDERLVEIVDKKALLADELVEKSDLAAALHLFEDGNSGGRKSIETRLIAEERARLHVSPPE